MEIKPEMTFEEMERELQVALRAVRIAVSWHAKNEYGLAVTEAANYENLLDALQDRALTDARGIIAYEERAQAAAQPRKAG